MGTTDHVREIAYKQLGLVEGEDYHLLYVPERLAEGRAVQEEMTLPKLIGAYSTQGFQKGVDLLTRIGSDIIRLSSPAAAEFAKLVDNAYRNTMFAFANELARAAEEERLDAWEIIEACNARYPRNSIPRPGPVSGYCLGKDPYLLGRSLKEREDGALVPDYLWMQARQDNERLFERVASEIAADVRAQSLRDPHVLVLGLAFKEGVDDFRMSHAFSIIRALRAKILDLTLTLYDPAVNSNRYTQIPEDIAPLAQKVTSRLDDALATSADVAVIATPDACLRQLSGPAQLVNSAGAQAPKPALVYDCWNLWRGAPSTTAVTYRALGVGPQEVQGQQ